MIQGFCISLTLDILFGFCVLKGRREHSAQERINSIKVTLCGFPQ